MGGAGGKSGMRVSKADVEQLRGHPVDSRRIARLFRPLRVGLVTVVAIIVLCAELNLVPAICRAV